MDGSTAAVAVLLPGTVLPGRCLIGNVGDSEVVLGTRNGQGRVEVQVLTEMHNPSRNEAEARRVETLSGSLWQGRLAHPRFNPRVLSLAVSRAIGDLGFKDARFTGGSPGGLSAQPFVASVDLPAGVCLLLACDGFWGSVSYLQAVQVAFERLDGGLSPQAVSEHLVELALERGSTDNVTVIVVTL